MILKAKIDGNETNVMLDTGAGVSIVDMGTLERMNLVKRIQKSEIDQPKCFDASGNQMEIIGTIKLKTKLIGTDPE